MSKTVGQDVGALLETQLHEACKCGDHTALCRLVETVNEDIIITYAVQQKQHLLLEDVVKYLIMLISRPGSESEIDQTACDNLLGLISRYLHLLLASYKLINTRLEGWISLYLKSKATFSQVHDIQYKGKSQDESEEEKEDMADNAEQAEEQESARMDIENSKLYSVVTCKSDVGQAVTNVAGVICK